MTHLPKRHLFILLGGILGGWYLLDVEMAADWMRWVMLAGWVPLIVWIFVRCPNEWDEMHDE
ncbi:MAG: hypothetical protein MK074_04380 [Phycisphaerales bacterium]|nr:hypothetical protein [Phycisphaerales bacterium]